MRYQLSLDTLTNDLVDHIKSTVWKQPNVLSLLRETDNLQEKNYVILKENQKLQITLEQERHFSFG